MDAMKVEEMWKPMLQALVRRWRWALVGALAGTNSVAGADASSSASKFAEGPEAMPTLTILGREPDSPPQTDSSAVSYLPAGLIGPGGAKSVRDLQSFLPSFSVFDSDNDRIPRFSTRGLRENNFGRGEPAVALYVDDVPYSDLSSRGLALYEVERGAFSRGPRGTLYGVSGPGGVLELHTRQPGDAYYASGTFGYGNYNRLEGQVAASGPIVEDRLSLGVAGFHSSRDGYVHNRFLGTDPDEKEDWSGRIQARWTPSEKFEVGFTASAERFNDGLVPTYYPGSDANLFDISRDVDGYVDTEALTQSLRVRYLADTFHVTSITAHRTWEQSLLQDFDFSAAPGVLGFSRPDMEQWSQEIRVQSTAPVGELRWLAGFFFLDRESDTESGSVQPLGQPVPFPPGFIPGPLTRLTAATQNDRLYAGFGQVTANVLPGLEVMGGVRLEHNEREIARSRSDDLLGILGMPPIPAYETEDDFGAVLPRAGLVYHCWSNHDLYFNVSAGYQAGGFNPSNDNPGDARYDSSRSWHYELGHKADWIKNRLSTRVAAYYATFDDYQVFRFNQADPTQAVVVNADSVYSYGVEAEVLGKPIADLELSALFSAGDARFDKFDLALGGQTYDFADRHVNFVPQFNLTLAAEYRVYRHWVGRVEWQGVGEYYLDEENTARQGAFGLLNVRLGYERRSWGAFVFARNVFDTEYVSNAIDFRNAFQPDLLVRQPGDPLTFGFVVSCRY